MVEEAGKETRNRNLPQSDSEEEAQLWVNHLRNNSQGANGENPRQNHSQRACGENNEVKQQRVSGEREEHEDLERWWEEPGSRGTQQGIRSIRCATLSTPAKTFARRRISRQSESTNRSSKCVCLCRLWKRPSQEWSWPHMNRQQRRRKLLNFPRRSSLTRVLTIAWRRRDKSSPSGDETKQSRSLRFDAKINWWTPVVQRRTDATGAVPELEAKSKSKLETLRSEIRRDLHSNSLQQRVLKEEACHWADHRRFTRKNS